MVLWCNEMSKQREAGVVESIRQVNSDDSVGDSEERGALAGADGEEAIELDDGGRSGRGRADSAESGIATLFLGGAHGPQMTNTAK